jgi:predicted MFS family arabinose efflux permease
MMPRSLGWLALGAFSVGMEGFMIAGLLPAIADEFHVSVAAAGQLVTVFALVYALGSPLWVTIAANVDRKRLLVCSLSAFMLANLLAAMSQSYLQLVLARVLLATAAGLFMPTANAVAVTMVEPGKRGRAVAVVTGGITVALALGVPIGTFIGAIGSWRTAFLVVAATSCLGVLGLLWRLPANLPRVATTLSQRICVLRKPAIPLALAVLMVAVTGGFSAYTYIAPLLERATAIDPSRIGAVLLLFGCAAAIGNTVGGIAADRFGAARTIPVCLLALALVHASIGTAALCFSPESVRPAILVGVALWGFFGWALYPGHMARLVHLAPNEAMVTLSLNASALYLGTAAGATLGAFAMSTWGVLAICGTASCCAIVALILFHLSNAQVRSMAQKDPIEARTSRIASGAKL